MSWPFVSRTDQLDVIRAAVRGGEPGLIVVSGRPGAGRTALAGRAVRPSDGVPLLRVDPAGDQPFSALLPHLPTGLRREAALREAEADAVAQLAARAGGRRLVVVVDDAHRVDQASLLALRALVRRGEALLLVTRSVTGGSGEPDPTDCLSYEPGLITLELPPLTYAEVNEVVVGVLGGRVRGATVAALHSATAGNARRLHDLLVLDGVLEHLVEERVEQQAVWRVGPAVGAAAVGLVAHDATDLVEAAWQAWRDLAFDKAEELCRLALWRGAGEQVAGVHSTILLLRGQAGPLAAFADSLPPRCVVDQPQVALATAMGLALLGGRVDEAGSYLLEVAALAPQIRERVLAYRTWILTVAGRLTEVPDLVGLRDREAGLFAHVSAAAVLLRSGRARQALFHLRRALAKADGCQDDVPWMRPYLTAFLGDALLLAGRVAEATALAGDFHAARRGSGWDLAVAFVALTTGGAPPVPTSGPARAA